MNTAADWTKNAVWEERRDANGNTYLALRTDSGNYVLVYYNDTYYKPTAADDGSDLAVSLADANHVNNWDPVSFTVDQLTSDESYYYRDGYKVHWSSVEAPTGVPVSSSGPGSRSLNVTDTGDWNYRADMWLSKDFQYNRAKREWEPYRDGCTVVSCHNGGTDVTGVVWHDGRYYKAKDANGVDTEVKLLGSGFSAEDLEAGGGTYNGTDVIWFEIPDPYRQGEVSEGDNPPTLGVKPDHTLDSALSDEIQYNSYQWYRYRDGCIVAARNNGNNEWGRATPIVWYEGHYYKPSIPNPTDVTIGVLNEGFYPSHLTDNEEHPYGYGSTSKTVRWQLKS
ncbi:MAG: hypothetical protein IKF14_07405 [Atopobiaceae bacterium]|nr:hypothetical protein [Atopobiaceae bacterium]